jgi:hypothetical protein
MGIADQPILLWLFSLYDAIGALARSRLLIALSILTLVCAGCSGDSSSAALAPAVEPTATAVAGRVSVSFNASCRRVAGGAALSVNYRASATEEKRLIRITVSLNEEVLFDSGDIDKSQESGSVTVRVDSGARATIEVKAMPQDGRSAAGRKNVACPGSQPGFRASGRADQAMVVRLPKSPFSVNTFASTSIPSRIFSGVS